jgi:GT2 family glycosyltransferase
MISVIVVNYNGKRFLEGCLTSLVRQTAKDFEVIVVDNGSDDGSDSDVKTFCPYAFLIKLNDNKGYPAALNRGIEESHGDFILTLNNDTELDPLFIEELLSSSEDEAVVGMWATKMILPDGRINSTGICISRSGAAWDRGMFEEDTGQFDKPGEVFGPCGGAALYRKKMLDDIGIFDEDFFLFMEDVDIAFRGRLAGWRCLYKPSARVVHQHGGTSVYGSDLAVYNGNRNILWYVVKDFPAGLLIRYLPWIIGRNLGVLLYYSIRGQGMIALKAKIDGVAGLRKMIRKRKYMVRKEKDSDLARFIGRWYNPRKREIIFLR